MNSMQVRTKKWQEKNYNANNNFLKVYFFFTRWYGTGFFLALKDSKQLA
jgi:hypothetical protein